MVLPQKHAGLFWVRGRDAKGKLRDMIAVEVVRPTKSDDAPQWILKSNRKYKIHDDKNRPAITVQLDSGKLYAIQSTSDPTLRYALYAEPISDDRKQFTAYEVINSQGQLTIGRSADNDICYANKFTSDKQATLSFSSQGVFVNHIGTTNKTYVNGVSVDVQGTQLRIGDVIYIMGLQIIVTPRFIFINNSDGNIHISGGLQKYSSPQTNVESSDTEADYEFEDISDDYFYRPPRFKFGVDTFELAIDSPPANQNNDEVPLIMLIGPSMTMGMAAICTNLK